MSGISVAEVGARIDCEVGKGGGRGDCRRGYILVSDWRSPWPAVLCVGKRLQWVCYDARVHDLDSRSSVLRLQPDEANGGTVVGW